MYVNPAFLKRPGEHQCTGSCFCNFKNESHQLFQEPLSQGFNLGINTSYFPSQPMEVSQLHQFHNGLQSHYYMPYSTNLQPPPSGPSRVHINPNFRPNWGNDVKAVPSNVHVNPHWRPKDRGPSSCASSSADKPPKEHSNKSRIHVNPKLFAQMNSISAKTNEVEMSMQAANDSTLNVEDNQVQSNLSRVQTSTPFLTSSQNSDNISFASSLQASNKTLGRRSSSSNFLSPTVKVAKLVCSKYKLVRNTYSCVNSPKSNLSPASMRRSRTASTCKSQSKYKLDRKSEFSNNSLIIKDSLNKKSPHIVKPKTVKSRYKLVRKELTEKPNRIVTTSKMALGRFYANRFSKPLQSRFKLSRIPEENTVKMTYKYRSKHVQKLPASRYKYVRVLKSPRVKLYTTSQNNKLHSNRVWHRRKSLQPVQVSVTHRTLHRIGKSYVKQRVASYRKEMAATPTSQLISIGDILYRSTPTSLTRAPLQNRERVVHVRGRKFILDAKGKTLRHVSDNQPSKTKLESYAPLRRLDIGGFTFVQSGSTTLVRTNTHMTRNLLSQAKLKSIALLTRKLRKNNQTCLIYHRFGRCYAYEKGTCWRVHDPKNIAICRKFLLGNCEEEKCLLSHNVVPEKMPTCRYFLEGFCVREKCPYLHVKLNPRTEICRNFLNGYCTNGEKCKNRHVYLCPDFSKSGKCQKGKYCPYPHESKIRDHCTKSKTVSSATDRQKLKQKNNKGDKVIHPEQSSSQISTNIESSRKRYYDDNDKNEGEKDSETSNDLKEKRKRIMKHIHNYKEKITGACNKEVGLESEPNDDDQISTSGLHYRPKLGILPSFIPLE